MAPVAISVNEGTMCHLSGEPGQGKCGNPDSTERTAVTWLFQLPFCSMFPSQFPTFLLPGFHENILQLLLLWFLTAFSENALQNTLKSEITMQ